MINWNNKARVLDPNGVSINSYPFLFKFLVNKKEKVDYLTILYIMTSYFEIYEDDNYRPISPMKNSSYLDC
jgi:hypothetical protein